MEGRVKSFLLCLGDEELLAPSPPNMHTHACSIAESDFIMGIFCAVFIHDGSDFFESSTTNWLDWMDNGAKNVFVGVSCSRHIRGQKCCDGERR